jgi:glutamate formiminotransferase / 5-formyltetrahydrofolate cyclo-ligase
MAVPNVSEGRDAATIDAIGAALTAHGARLLDVHSDADHGRTVFTLIGPPRSLAHGLAQGAQEAATRIDLTKQPGQHPRVGALDVAPVVFLDGARRAAPCAEALLAADLIGEQGLPVYLYGLLAGGRTRAELRRPDALDDLRPDFGPSDRDPRHGAVLVAARPPLVAFNLFVDATLEQARAIARAIREGGPEGLQGVKALAMEVEGRAQVSTNVEDHRAIPLRTVLEATRRHAPVLEAELVGLAPAAAFAGWPDDVPVRHFRTLEDAGAS